MAEWNEFSSFFLSLKWRWDGRGREGEEDKADFVNEQKNVLQEHSELRFENWENEMMFWGCMGKALFFKGSEDFEWNVFSQVFPKFLKNPQVFLRFSKSWGNLGKTWGFFCSWKIDSICYLLSLCWFHFFFPQSCFLCLLSLSQQ